MLEMKRMKAETTKWWTPRHIREFDAYSRSDPNDARHQLSPIRVAIFDVEDPLLESQLTSNEEYLRAWMVLTSENTPRTMSEIDMTLSAKELDESLATQRNIALDVAARNVNPTLVRDAWPFVSVIIPSALRRRDDLSRCLEALGQLDYPEYEVILVDNARSPTSYEIIDPLRQRFPWLRVECESKPGIAAARNAGTAVARGEILAFTDDDVSVDRNWLKCLASAFLDAPKVGAIGGLVLPAVLDSSSQIWTEKFFHPGVVQRRFDRLTFALDSSASGVNRRSILTARDDSGQTVKRLSLFAIGGYVAGANVAFRTEILRDVGNFDVRLGVGTPTCGGEDVLPIIRLLENGYLFATEPSAFVFHRHRQNYEELARQVEGYGIGLSAMLTEIIWRDPRHVVSLLLQLPRAIRSKMKPQTPKSSAMAKHRLDDPPAHLRMIEMRGLIKGPFAYWRSARLMRRWVSP